MSLNTLVLLLVLASPFSQLSADIFKPVDPPQEFVEDLASLDGVVEIIDAYDISHDGQDDYIIRYLGSASNYGEFLHNVLVSTEGKYRKAFLYDDYFIDMFFEKGVLVGVQRQTNEAVVKRRFTYDASSDSLQEDCIPASN